VTTTLTAGLMLDAILMVGFDSGPQASSLQGFSPAVKALSWDEIGKTVQAVQEIAPDLIILKPGKSHQRALDFLAAVRAGLRDTPVVISMEHSNADTVIRYIHAGAYDCMTGTLTPERLLGLADCVWREKSRLRQKMPAYFSPSCHPNVPIVGQSADMIKTLDMIRVVGQSRCNPVLILGATGTGKELAAQAVHAWRYCNTEKFVAVNCAALTANLLESELFGHVRGAFTGADRDKTGLFELASGGSIFLDEISEMPLDLQAKLLRVLQERAFRKVGGSSEIPCDATVIASSNRDLFREALAGRFRRDLYYRLAVFPISIPTLNSPGRQEDISTLAGYFAESFRPGRGPIEFSAEAMNMLKRHDWPGNVRELKNVIERAMILERGERITPQSIFIDHQCAAEPCLVPAQPAAGHKESDFSLETAEREFICRALKEVGWQRSKAAALLGITRATLLAKIKRYDIKAPGEGLAASPQAQAI
jgi:two-component system response regulator HydG